MGMYTDFHLNVELHKNIPGEVIDLLKYMTGQNKTEPSALPDHLLFEDTRWDYMLQCTSYYFPPTNSHSVVYEETNSKESLRHLSVLCNFKNYDYEIDLFLDWLHPYVSELNDAFVGYCRYETTEDPTLIYYSKKGFYYMSVGDERSELWLNTR